MTPEDAELCARLRNLGGTGIVADVPLAAAARIEVLAAEVEQLRDLLQKIGDRISPEIRDVIDAALAAKENK